MLILKRLIYAVMKAIAVGYKIIERRDYMDMNDGNPIILFELDIPGKMREHKIPFWRMDILQNVISYL